MSRQSIFEFNTFLLSSLKISNSIRKLFEKVIFATVLPRKSNFVVLKNVCHNGIAGLQTDARVMRLMIPGKDSVAGEKEFLNGNVQAHIVAREGI